MTDLGLTSAQTRQIPNFVNGSRSVTAIRNRVAAATGTSLTVEQVAGYLAILEVVGWVVMK
jgi:hypothetical protein